MTNAKKEQEFNPWQAYFIMGAGACIILAKLIKSADLWSTLDIIKVGVGAAGIGYGIFKLIKKK